MAYYMDDKFEGALRCFTKSTELIPNLPKGLEMISGVFYHMGNYKKSLKYLKKAMQHGANAKNDINFSEFESFVYYRNALYKETIASVEKAFTYGEKYRNSDNLNKVYNLAKGKLDSIQSLGN
ncbi:hypothetical protein NBT05_11440 [Aquimarina sp. ERC-38]|uniref:hypothetical protein n=1 Tax=Aquimarina sp. ERC-38 TaxID=2949996 RepID=UPI0022462426|nr:hypothetical protein [Aquimarina sp. ERC-38]UZO79569.1 hypothetical protein NBT05_11440 [Aquimarina sp. ERC-38]